MQVVVFLVPALSNLLIDPVLYDQFHLLLRHALPATDPDLDFEQVEERLNCFKIGIWSGKSPGFFNMDHHQFVKMRKFPGYIDDLFERHTGEMFRGTFCTTFIRLTIPWRAGWFFG
jgi:hypothetical protein